MKDYKELGAIGIGAIALIVGVRLGYSAGYVKGAKDTEDLCAPSGFTELKELCENQKKEIEKLKHKETVVEVVR